jgi:hypothetical protein
VDDGHTVNFSKIPDRNIVETIVNGETVYTSNIQNFQFGKLTGTGESQY